MVAHSAVSVVSGDVNERERLKEHIARVLGEPDTVLFIGSGLSQWSGLPSWPVLIERLAQFIEERGLSAELVRRELGNGDLIQAASFGVDKLSSKRELAEFIRSACLKGQALPHEVHMKVVTLGPSCFVTTNYDDLLEQSFRLWRQERAFRIISNKQVTETADIIRARAEYFLFKPHGDLDDADSIVLTREDYRKLRAERRHIVSAMEVLLVSRPVVFVGFGLRDPDFLLVKESILEKYKGGTREQYAIMADVSEEEGDYWRRQYGIRILGCESAGGDRKGLLALLDTLGRMTIEPRTARTDDTSGLDARLTEREVLSMARYCDRVCLVGPKKVEPEIPLCVSALTREKGYRRRVADRRFDGESVEQLLETCDRNIVLVGNPGSGKTYALGRLCVKLAERMRDACLREPGKLETLTMPVYIDLKLYGGSLREMVDASLPPEVSLERLIPRIGVRFILDSYNELPHKYVGSPDFEKDLSALVEKAGYNFVVIASRTDPCLGSFQSETYALGEIEESYVRESLKAKGYDLKGSVGKEIVRLLRKPLFYRLLVEGRVDLGQIKHPGDVFESFFDKLGKASGTHFGMELRLDAVFEGIAFQMIDEGVEALAVSRVLEGIGEPLGSLPGIKVNEKEVVNWLINYGFLVPYPGSYIGFFHQSVTEYLAARVLARSYTSDRMMLSEWLKSTRWDQALFLATDFLDEDVGACFTRQLLATELDLAIRSAKYLEKGQEAMVSAILEALVGRSFRSLLAEIQTSWLLEELSVSRVHGPHLRRLVARGNVLGGTAARLLIQAFGLEVRDEMIGELLKRRGEYNFCSELGRGLAEALSEEDLVVVVGSLVEEIVSDRGRIGDVGLRGALTEICRVFDPLEILALLPRPERMNHIQRKVMCEILGETSHRVGIERLLSLVRSGVGEAIFYFYVKLRFENGMGEIGATEINEELIAKLVGWFADQDVGRWAMEATRMICKARKDLAAYVTEMCADSSGVMRLALLYCILEEQEEAFWEEMSLLANVEVSSVGREPVHLLSGMDEVNWTGHEDVLMRILNMRNIEIVEELVEPLFDMERWQSLSRITLLPIEWWLEWMEEALARENAKCFVDRMAFVIGWYGCKDTRAAIIEVFNKSAKYRELIRDWVFPRMADVSTDELNEDSISFLIRSLSADWHRFAPTEHPLGRMATESFVERYLVPLVNSEDEMLRANVRLVLREAGKRHKRRYFAERGKAGCDLEREND